MEIFTKKAIVLPIFLALCFVALFGCIGLPSQNLQGEQKSAGQQNGAVAEEAGKAAEEQLGAASESTARTENVSIEEEIKKTKMKEISFTTKDRWLIYGDIYYAQTKSPAKAMVLLHQLGMDRKSYSELVPLLQSNFPDYDIIAIDFRGHGKSTNLGTYQSFVAGDYRAMKNDVEGLTTYLRTIRPTIKEYYLIGSSIGSSVALDYASKNGDVKKVVMISPGLSYRDYDISDSARYYLYKLCLAAGFEDRYSSQSAQTIYEMSPSDSKEIKIYYDNDAHGVALFDSTKNSDAPLAQFVLSCLR